MRTNPCRAINHGCPGVQTLDMGVRQASAHAETTLLYHDNFVQPRDMLKTLAMRPVLGGRALCKHFSHFSLSLFLISRHMKEALLLVLNRGPWTWLQETGMPERHILDAAADERNAVGKRGTPRHRARHPIRPSHGRHPK